jgi:arsenite methyltransferase
VGPKGRVIGVDMTDAMIEKARANIEAAGHANVDLRKGIIEEIPLEDGEADWVISNCVINLSPDKPRVFAEIVRVLKPGGRMRVSDIVVEEMPEWLRGSEALYNSCVAGAISEDEYLDGLSAAGLEDAKVIERYHYEGAQLEAFIASELSEGDAALDKFEELSRDEAVIRIASEMAGKVWSAKIQARKI